MNRESYIYLLGGLFIIIVWLSVIFIPYQQDKQTFKTSISDNMRQLKDYELTMNLLPEYIKKKQGLDSLKNVLNSRLYTKEDVIKLFEELKKEATLNNLEVTEVTPPIEELILLNQMIPDSTKPQFLNIGINVRGDFVNFGRFVEVLEKSGYFRGINRCRLTGNRSGDKFGVDYYFGFKALLGRYKG